MLKQWLMKLFGRPAAVEPEPEPEPLSDDPWKRSKQLAAPAYMLTLDELGVDHFDYTVSVCSDNVYELLAWLEISIRCIETEGSVTEEWKLDQRQREPINVVDYYFHDKTGYWHPQEVWIQVLEKIRIIHHLIEVKGIDASHIYYVYMRKYLTVVVRDAAQVLETTLAFSNKS